MPNPERRGDGLEQALLAGVFALSALVALTCASDGSFGAPPRSAPPAAAPAKSAEAGAVRAAEPGPATRPSAAPAAPATQPTAAHELGRFFTALSELEQKKRREPVRIVWLGDSHTAADFWTGVVRRALGERFGVGGPGFLRAGVHPYRHDLVKVGREGRFRVQPDSPARRTPQGDGVFGLGGMRVLPDVGARATIELDARAFAGPAHFEVWYRLSPGSALRVELGKQVLALTESSGERVPGSPIARVKLTGMPGEVLGITATAGAPEIFGVVAERAEPGVVLDAAGIDGARLATPLAWAEEPFVAEIAARQPALVAVAYGTNEVFDAVRVDRYAEQLRALVGRLRRGAPNADCLVVGPPDSAARGGGSEPRVLEIDRLEQQTAHELGCAYLSAFALMGGEGSFARFMQETPRLARPDRIHLTPKGYEKLGEATARELLSRYDAWRRSVAGAGAESAATRP